MPISFIKDEKLNRGVEDREKLAHKTRRAVPARWRSVPQTLTGSEITGNHANCGERGFWRVSAERGGSKIGHSERGEGGEDTGGQETEPRQAGSRKYVRVRGAFGMCI